MRESGHLLFDLVFVAQELLNDYNFVLGSFFHLLKAVGPYVPVPASGICAPQCYTYTQLYPTTLQGP